mgnify:CR=1 FL=1
MTPSSSTLTASVSTRSSGVPARWPSEQAAADALWSISQSFGPHTPEQWLALTRPMLVPDGDGFALHYDPAIAVPVRATTAEASAQGEALLWQLYDNIQAHTLLTRGADSDMLTRDTAAAMSARLPIVELSDSTITALTRA